MTKPPDDLIASLLQPPAEQVELEQILATEELKKRKSRQPNYKLEAEGLVELSEALANSPETILQKLSEVAQRLCDAESAGVSIAEIDNENGKEIFRWRGVSGKLSPFLLGTMPRDFSPCGYVLRSESPQLMVKMIGHYQYVSQLGMPLHEVLLVPFYSGDQVAGTIWVVAHTPGKKFDSEDLRLLESLCRFASAAYRSYQDNANRGQAEERLTMALEAARLGFWNLNLKTREVKLSDRLVNDWGIANFNGDLQTAIDKIDPRDQERVQKAITGAIATKSDYDIEYRVSKSASETIWIRAQGRLRTDDAGLPSHFTGTSLDITDRKIAELRLSSEQTKLEAVFYGSNTGMVLFRGQDLIYEMINESYQKLIPGRDVLGKSLLQALPEIAESEYPKAIRRVYDTGEPLRNLEGYTPIMNPETGLTEDRYFDTVFSRISDSGNDYLVVGQAMDVTERVASRKALEEAKREAEKANQMKSSFLANMSHEIRTPLGAILGFSSLLKERALDPEERDQYVDTIVRNGTSLTRIIDDILDLAKVEANRLAIEKIEFSIYELATEVVDLFRDKTRQKGIHLLLNIDESVPEWIQSDPSRIRQVLVNLIGNAVKFTEEGGVRVNIKRIGASNSEFKVVVDVKDTGVGISEEQMKTLFQPFVQADNSTARKFGGTGLGLVLSQRLANVLGGNIVISECMPGNGCTFSFSFPTAAANKQKSPAKNIESSHKESLLGVRVLVVDDSPDNQFLVKRLLSRNGAEVESADGGLEAIKKTARAEYDIVLMDIQMPEMDGYQTKKQLDEMGYPKPIIALTAHAMLEEREKTKAAGFAAHLTKPLIPAEMIRSIRNVISE